MAHIRFENEIDLELHRRWLEKVLRQAQLKIEQEKEEKDVDIGTFIKKRRVAVGKSMRDVEKDSGINASYISKLERGISRPSPEYLRKLSGSLDTPYDELMQVAGYWDEANKPKFYTLPDEVMKGLTEDEQSEVLRAAAEEAKRVANVIKKYKGLK